MSTVLVLNCSGSDQAAVVGMAGIPQWRADSVPAVDIAGSSDDGLLNFERPVWATRMPNGEIVVADQWGAALRFFSPTGELIRTAGQRGEGPGEFSRPMWVDRCGGDSLFVSDIGHRDVKVVNRSGTWVRDFSVQSRPDWGSQRPILGCNRRGNLAVFHATSIPIRQHENGEWVPHLAALTVADRDGNITTNLGEMRSNTGSPIDQVTQVAVSDVGIYVGTGDSAWIDVYALSGEKTHAFPVGVERRPPTRRHHDIAAEEWGSVFANRDERARWADIAADLELPKYLPAYTGLRIDPAGLLWVVLSVPGDPHTLLRAFDAAGEPIADLRFPADMTVFEVGSDYVLGRFDDEIGEWHVGAFRFHRTP